MSTNSNAIYIGNHFEGRKFSREKNKFKIKVDGGECDHPLNVKAIKSNDFDVHRMASIILTFMSDEGGKEKHFMSIYR